MESRTRYLEFYRRLDGSSPFEIWFNSLDLEVQSTIARRLDRIQRGLLGDTKPIGEGVTEFRIHEGPGHRFLEAHFLTQSYY